MARGPDLIDEIEACAPFSGDPARLKGGTAYAVKRLIAPQSLMRREEVDVAATVVVDHRQVTPAAVAMLAVGGVQALE